MRHTELLIKLTTNQIEDLYLNGIYIIECKINNKFYIGSCRSSNSMKSKNGFYRRWSHHISRLRLNKHNNKHLQNCWNKYGENSFSFQILEICETDILEREQHYIDLHFENVKCLNINRHTTSTYNVKKSYSYEKLSLLYKGKVRDRKIFETQCKPILQYSLEGIFIKEHESIGLAALNTHTNRQDIHKVLSGKIISSNNNIWRYKEENFPIKINSKKELLKLKDNGRFFTGLLTPVNSCY